MLYSEWSKEIELSRQNFDSTYHPFIVSNPIDKKGSEFMRRSMRWEAPSMPTSAHDPGLKKAAQLQRNNNWWWCDQARFEGVGVNRYFHWRFCVITVPCV